MLDKKILNAIGIFALFGLIILIFKMINKKTETKLYSDEAFKALQDKNKLQELDDAVSAYHKNGKWGNTVLK